jgi:hypothetical protein
MVDQKLRELAAADENNLLVPQFSAGRASQQAGRLRPGVR